VSESNKTPEQLARDNIDAMLSNAGPGIAVRQYPADTESAEYATKLIREKIK